MTDTPSDSPISSELDEAEARGDLNTGWGEKKKIEEGEPPQSEIAPGSGADGAVPKVG